MDEERGLCPTCGEEVASFARRCRHCGEALAGEGAGELGGQAIAAFLGGVVLCALLCVAASIAATVSVPGVRAARKAHNEAEAVRALRAIAEAQARLRGDGGAGFGDLGALGAARLLEPDLVTGVHAGYVFEVAPATTDPTRAWIAVATPIEPGRSGDRAFGTSHRGGVYERHGRPFPLDTLRCELPPDATPVP